MPQQTSIRGVGQPPTAPLVQVSQLQSWAWLPDEHCRNMGVHRDLKHASNILIVNGIPQVDELLGLVTELQQARATSG
jgi:hypothetical protein